MDRSLPEIARESGHSNKPARYLDTYQHFFSSMQSEPIALFELGVHRGGSLQMWGSYFSNGTVVGIDRKRPYATDGTARVMHNPDGTQVIREFVGDNIHFYQGQQEDADLLARVSDQHAPEGWDVVIDDCSHIGRLTQASLLALFPRLKGGGIYIIEDWETGYWGEYYDGVRFDPTYHLKVRGDNYFPSHPFGQSGFVKQLIDELAMHEITQPEEGYIQRQSSMFASVHFYKGICIVRK